MFEGDEKMLFKMEKDHLPLFLISDDGCECYIIDNEVLLAQIGGGFNLYPFNAYYQLSKILCSEQAKGFLPDNLQSYLSSSYELPTIKLHKYLAGYCDDYIHHIVSLDSEIIDHPTQPVVLRNIHYQNHGFIRKFDSINLSFKEAFLLFGNILSNGRATHPGHIDSNCELTSDSHPNKFHKSWLKDYGRDYHLIVNFSHFYYHYLKSELLSGTLTPYEIAFYGGTTSLASLSNIQPVKEFTERVINSYPNFNNLSRNQKIIYYCFLLELVEKYDTTEKYNIKGYQLLDEFEVFAFKKLV